MTPTICFQSPTAHDAVHLLEALRLLAMRAEVAAFGHQDEDSINQRLAVLLDLFETIDAHDPGLGHRLLCQALPSAVSGGDAAWSRLVDATPDARHALSG